MDLRNVLNDSNSGPVAPRAAASAPDRPLQQQQQPSHPQQYSQHPQQLQRQQSYQHPHQQQQQQRHPGYPQPPTTPGQGPHPGQQHQSYIDYNNRQSRPSPGRHISQDSGYGTQQRIPSGPGAFASSPPPFSGPPATGPSPYANRPPPPPPLQQVPAHDPRSPSLASGPGPSPYRHTPTSSISAQSTGYPFPPSAQHTPTSPVQRPYNQYPPSSTASYPSREAYPPTPGGPVGVTGPQPPPPPGPGIREGAPYLQGPPGGIPQTPPINTVGAGPSGGHNPYLQRSQSTHSGSTPTPTSAHSQGPPGPSGPSGPGPGPGHSHSHSHPQVYGPPFGRGSPVTGPHSLPQNQNQPGRPGTGAGGQIVDPQQQRQSSQPVTPVAGPGPLTASTAGPAPGTRPLPQASVSQPVQAQQAQSQSQNLQNHYSQPPSPYQQRPPLPPASATTHHHLNLNSPRNQIQQIPSPHSRPAPQLLPQQPQPQPPPPPTQSQSLPRQHSAQSIYEARERERELRERSISISPKTRVPSLPSSAGRPATATSAVSIPESEPSRTNSHTATAAAAMARYRDEVPPATLNAAAKRKLDDRELKTEELERRDVRPPPFENRNRTSNTANKGVKRRLYDSPPSWAQQATRGTHLKEPNFVLYKPVHAPGHGPVQLNGHSRHPSPEDKRSVSRAHEPAPRVHEIRPNERSSTPGTQGPPAPQANWGPLGPWESSITGDSPQDTMAKVMADFFFHYIVLNENMGEIQSRGIQFEIEAKFGELIDRNTNQRIDLGILSPTILKEDDHHPCPFRSIMTEAQHRTYNEYLNHQVVVSKNPKSNIGRERPRVPISYEHKHEIDRFYHIPQQARDRYLPVTVANLLASKGRDAKVRVSFKENKDGSREQIAKIVKARLKDLSIHFPEHRLDCRISINLEMPWEGPVEELEAYATSANKGQSPDRRKNRLSYGHSSYQFDLTQVVENVNGRDEKKHELEIELEAKAILDQGRRAREGQPNQYFDLVEGFLNNIRIMAKVCA